MIRRSGIVVTPGNSKRKVFFSEEKKQMTFIREARASPAAHANEQKFFGSFFQKRTFFFLAFRSYNNRHIDLHEQIRIRQSGDHDERTGRPPRLTKIRVAARMDGWQQVAAGTEFTEHGIDIAPYLADLGIDVALADDGAVLVPRHLTRDENRCAGLDDGMIIE
jgi:hypothetical protein